MQEHQTFNIPWFDIQFLDIDKAQERARVYSQLKYGDFTVFPAMIGTGYQYVLRREGIRPGAVVSFRNGSKTYPL